MPKRKSKPNPLECIRKRPLAKLLGINPWTIDAWRKRGLIPQPIRISHVVMWPMAEITAWLATRERASNMTPWKGRGRKRREAVRHV